MAAVTDAEQIYTESYLQFLIKHRRALMRIPSWMCSKGIRQDECPVFHYGVGVTLEHLRVYGIKHGILPLDDAEIALSVISCVGQVVSDIAKRGKVKLYHTMVTHHSYTNAVALYTNYNKHRRYRSSEEDEKAVSFIKAELGLPSDCRALWYWDDDTPKTVTAETLPIPKTVESRMQRLKIEDGNQNLEFESVDEELIQRYASFDTEPNTVWA
ncbi:hypothetical protein PUNSTDRAFT_143637 [Punctularia strigosozonata HHB-11173 SS5]|uniref:uncharacterized protein n=1 Tax=Punctularia strigosozonata (strain HHB-11173) TaxID=741275 RepID=UPI00044174B2|nr:uncharacterized protein PUNSTDRAFT_143637 [Punctularia strigosozonata HHB-11173 SS5]EIN08997.1 hypothetical protein PUNSTDRAFT_143637 [Punctularia strigosozonata HHB-11173 SS5]